MLEVNRQKERMADYYDKACDSCPFQDECEVYQEAFGKSECLRDDWAKSLMDFIRDKEKERENESRIW